MNSEFFFPLPIRNKKFMSFPITPEVTTAGVFGFYLVAYSGYDKATRQFRIPEKLKNILLCETSFIQSVKELNKVAGLASLTLIGLSQFIKQYSLPLATLLRSGTLLSYGINVGRVHGIFSMIEFRRRYTDSTYMLAMVLGSLTFWASFLLEPLSFPQIPIVDSVFTTIGSYGAVHWKASCFVVTGLALAHVLMMERKKGEGALGIVKPQMRPAGLVSLVVSGGALVLLGASLAGFF